MSVGRAIALTLTPATAQFLHERLQKYDRAAGRDHDQVSCWCCCWTCELDDFFDEIIANGKKDTGGLLRS